MRRLFVAILGTAIFFAAGNASAQGLIPQTTIEVTIKVSKEQIVMGPYARYSQKYLGINAPLNNKTIYTIEGVSIGSENFEDLTNLPNHIDLYSRKNDRLMKGNMVAGDGNSHIDFPNVSLSPIVTGSGIEKSDAELARNAADAIFTLRKRRFDMITGEYSDGIFGAGLGAAIEEMKRLENEYIQLFTGKKSTEYETYVFKVTPSKERDKYVVCRFSDNKGILPNVDITGEPVVLALRDLNAVTKPADKKKKGETSVARPDLVECTLFIGTEVVLAQTVEVYQFGETF